MNRDLSIGVTAVPARPDLSALLHTAARMLALWRRRSRTRAQLAALPSHLLRDIGLDALTADAEARKWFWRF